MLFLFGLNVDSLPASLTAGLGNMLFLFGLNVDSLPASLTATCFMPIVESSQNPSLVTDVALAKKSYHPSL